MHDDSTYVPPLPEHPDLREIAQALEAAGLMFEILRELFALEAARMMFELHDASFRCVFISSETVRAVGTSPDEASRLIANP